MSSSRSAIASRRPSRAGARALGESIAAKQACSSRRVPEQVAAVAEHRSCDALRDGGKVLLFGNGGSAADATHLAAEFVGRFRLDRAPLPALSLTDNASSVTAIGNDYGYDDVFARQIAGARPARATSRSGSRRAARRRTCSQALRAARGSGLRTVGLTGATAPRWRELADAVPVHAGQRHGTRSRSATCCIGHIVCELVERGAVRRRAD